jgi:DNA-binding winged helix-turn-helix (wHTH) protein
MASPQAPLALVRFGVFEADLRAGELRRNGIKVRLQDLPFRALTLLLTRPGEVITRDEFRQALWPADVFVDFEQGISSAVMRLRDALRDSADNPTFI